MRISYALVAFLLLFPAVVLAQTNASSPFSPVATAVHITGPELAYGDIIDHDPASNAYFLSQSPDDPWIYGVAVEHPPLVVYTDPQDVPVMRQGVALVNVTLENGPIAAGDGIIASSIAGKGMRAASSSAHIIGIARESFTGTGSTTSLTLQGKTVLGGTILVDIGNGMGGALGSGQGTFAGLNIGCTASPVLCNVLAKINAAPLLTLMRYVIAAAVAMGSLYLAFRSFMADAVNGVISVGRNPRAKSAIQAMVVFNAVLAAGIAAAGLAAGLAILFVKI